MILAVKWNEFETQIKKTIKEGNNLISKIDQKKSIELKDLDNEFGEWKKSTYNYLVDAFGIQKYAIEFRNEFIRHGRNSSNQDSFKHLKGMVLVGIDFLEYNTKIVGAGDLNTIPDQINLEQRKHFDTEEILDLLLTKLYKLYDDNSYPIINILSNNGIVLKRLHEDREYAKMLDNSGLVNISNDSVMYAQLTLEGKRHIENNRKINTFDFNSIDKTQKEMNQKIDEILLRFQKLDFGQEILAEELEELKELYSTLGKKTWGQTLKGKLMDLGYAQIINQEMATEIFKELTTQIHQIS